MTQITFEVGTIADAIRKAALVAPSRVGNAFDKAAGIMINITPDDEVMCVIQATNLDIFYVEAIDCIVASGQPARWRLPSGILAEILKNIKPAPGKSVTFTKDPAKEMITISCGRLKASIGMIDTSSYPEFSMYEGEFSTANNIGSRIDQVAWATAKAGSEPLTGVHFTGEHVIATDGYRVARMPLDMPIAEPVTVPANILSGILRQTGQVEIGATPHQMVFRPDPYTQITCSIFAMDYPKIADKVSAITYAGEFKIRKQDLIDLINRAMSAAGGDRSPIIQLIVGKGELAAYLMGQDARLGDVVELPGQLAHNRVSLYFSPQYIIDAVSKSPNDLITLQFDLDGNPKIPLKIDGGSGYESWIAARKAATAE